MRTAAVTVLTARLLLTDPLTQVAILGCGTLARAHLRLLSVAFPGKKRVSLYDVAAGARRRLAHDLRACLPDAEVIEAADPRSCVAGAQLIVLVTTATAGYIGYDWLAPGTVIAHVSLDDVLPEVVHRADLLLVDDWNLVAADPRRLVGRLYRAGQLLAPDGSRAPGVPPGRAPIRRVDGSLGDMLTGALPGRGSDADIVLSNPFGMAILDVAVAHHVLAAALALGLGRPLAL
jgi:ornithine cyclodeaminase